ncbi:MAG TPA: hypothetical protein VFI25_13655 [Planctomycetota bacterium]|jgi:hypothetical protein|nr:hypothetical protein [Planctomycetota bacterium]
MASRSSPPPVDVWSPRVTLERIGHLMSRGVLTLIYALLLGPVGVVYRFFADPLRTRRGLESTWTPWRSRNDSIDRARAQG